MVTIDLSLWEKWMTLSIKMQIINDKLIIMALRKLLKKIRFLYQKVKNS
jgi:hypothetical protein